MGGSAHDAVPESRGQRRADIDHGLAHRWVAELGRAMLHRDLVVVLKDAGAERLEYGAFAEHSERGQLSCAESTDAGGAEDVDLLGKRPENFLVTDCRLGAEVAVD